MSARYLSLSLILSLSLPLAAQSKDVETRKQAMIKEIQTVGARQKLTTQGLVNVFAIAKKYGFVQSPTGESRWTGEGGGQLGTINVASQEVFGVSIERNHYWTTQTSQVLCDAAIVGKIEKRKIQKELEGSCFELGSTSSQNTVQLYPEDKTSDEFLEEERNNPLISNYEATLSFDTKNQLKFKLTSGGQYYQTVYVWPVNETPVYRDEAKQKELQRLFNLKQDAEEKGNMKAANALLQQQKIIEYGKPILDIQDRSNIDRAQAIRDLKSSGLYNVPLNEKNAEKALALAIATGSERTTDIVTKMVAVLADRITKEKAIEKLITDANLDPSDAEKKARSDCNEERRQHMESREACKYARELGQARLDQINKLAGIDKLREEKADEWKLLHALDLQGLANSETDTSYLRVMLKLAKEEK